MKREKKLSEKLICVLLIQLRELQLSLQEAYLKKTFAMAVLVEFAKSHLEAHGELR